MWEVLRKTRVCDDDPNSAADFALPFHNDVGPDPSFEEMKKVVCIDNRRPEFLDSWRKSQVSPIRVSISCPGRVGRKQCSRNFVQFLHLH